MPMARANCSSDSLCPTTAAIVLRPIKPNHVQANQLKNKRLNVTVESVIGTLSQMHNRQLGRYRASSRNKAFRKYPRKHSIESDAGLNGTELLVFRAGVTEPPGRWDFAL